MRVFISGQLSRRVGAGDLDVHGLVGGLLAFGVALACFVLLGCGGSGDTDSEPYEHVYTVRARVVQLHDGSPMGEFRARHEAIPDYQAANGSVGMGAMEMPFAIVDMGVQEGVAVGDIVEITYGETHRPRVRQGVIAIRQLPNDTELDLGEEGPDGIDE